MKKKSVKIRRIAIQNYKGIDELELQFPPPKMSDDPDILVMGSENGRGKTAIIECCSLLLLAATRGEKNFDLQDSFYSVDVPELIIRAGSQHTEISGDIVYGEESGTVKIRIDRRGIVEISGDALLKKMMESELFDPEREVYDLVNAVCGFTPNPVVENTFLLFHSYRKVQEGNPELGEMIERNHSRKRRRPFYDFPMSEFKLRTLRSMMGKAQLFELVEDQALDDTIEKLNELVTLYASGTISKLRPSSDNTVDFRVQPLNGGDSFTFDGLSSGQKEIISTLFLVWDHTKNSPSVVFIDEPELHLNAQWHRSFVKQIESLAPWNQYIMATHSEDIMDTVDEGQRTLLMEGS